MPSNFYHIEPKRAREIVLWALPLCHYQRTDVLDCSKSFARQASTKTVEEVLAMAEAARHPHWSLIFREPMGRERGYAELGCRTGGPDPLGPEFFIWIHLTPEQGREAVERFGLTA